MIFFFLCVWFSGITGFHLLISIYVFLYGDENYVDLTIWFSAYMSFLKTITDGILCAELYINNKKIFFYGKLRVFFLFFLRRRFTSLVLAFLVRYARKRLKKLPEKSKKQRSFSSILFMATSVCVPSSVS